LIDPKDPDGFGSRRDGSANKAGRMKHRGTRVGARIDVFLA